MIFLNITNIFYRLLIIFICYTVFGILLNTVLNGEVFLFLYLNGFEKFLHYIFVGNNDKLIFHVKIANQYFYYFYFGLFIFILIIYLLKNVKKIIFSNNFIIKSKEIIYTNLKRKEIYSYIILSAGLSLFLELSIIRIHSSYLHFFSFLKNISLISCFLGLGIGYALKNFKNYSLGWIFPLFTIEILLLYLLSQTTISTILINPIAEQFTMGQDTARGFFHLLIIYFFLTIIFLFNALCFVPVGQLISQLMSKTKPLIAYGLNLIGSFVGIVLFVVLSFLQTSPVIWIIVSFTIFLFISRKDYKNIFISTFCVLILTIVLTYDLKGKKQTIYSPYQNVTLDFINSPINPVIVQVSHLFFQAVVNLSENLNFARDMPGDTRIFGPKMNVEHEREYYNLPFLMLKKLPENILIVGSGTGNDVAAANRFNIKNIDAVEIDPVIANIGTKYHPEHPYDNDNVNLIIDDARAYIKSSNNSYDAIIYGLLDSQTNLSSKGGIRLDSYVYTIEAFKEAKSKLNEDGFIYISFFVQAPELGYKIYKMLEKSFGHKPIVFKSEVNDRYVFFSPKNGKIKLDKDKTKFFKSNDYFKKEQLYHIDFSTDDWPFLYMPTKIYPLTYFSIIILLIVASVFFTNSIIKIKLKNFSFPCFFLGAGFMLIETKAITEIAKLYGSTWLVTSIVIATILLMAFLANLLVMKKIKISFASTYLLLIVSLIIGYYVSTSNFNFTQRDLNNLILPIILTLPILFSGIAFSKELMKLNSVSQALSANILGAMFGGFLEYNSMYFGLSSLYILSGFLYILAFIFSVQKFRTI